MKTQNHENPRRKIGSKISDIFCSKISPQASEAKEKINKTTSN